MSLTTKVLIALVAGLALGIGISMTEIRTLDRLVPLLEPVGALWINAIRMTVIPLVVGSIIVGVTAAPDPRTIGRIGGRALLLFVALLVLAGVFAALVAPLLVNRIPLDETAVATLRATGSEATLAAGESVKRIPTFAQWIVELVPVNPVKAAADGAMLPLILFSVVFGIAITRIGGAERDLLTRFFRGVADTALQLVRWVLVAAPVGVFALAVPLAAKLGLGAAGALAGYIGAAALVCTLFMLLLYPLTALLARTSIAEFARGAFPAQAVAFSARSSLAALPAMMEGARTRLKLPEQIVSFLLPLAASTFRIGGALGITTGVLFVARLYGVDLNSAQLATVVVTVILTTFSVPGIPAGSIIVMVPVLMAAGVPVEGMGVLLGADTIPDMFRTTSNVTGDMAAAAILGRGEERETATAVPRSAGA